MATKMVRRVGAGALAATAGALAPGMVSQANAAELPGLGDITDLVAPLDNKIPAPVPAPLPLKVADTLENALPANLLRRNSLVDDNTERANTDVPTISGDQVAAAMNRGAVAHKVRDTLNQFGVQVPGFDAADLDASGDPNVIGQLAATGTLPNAETLAQLRNDLTTLVSRVTSGDVLRDAGQAIDETLHSEEYAAWRASGGLDTINESLSGDERAVNGISTTIDAFTTNPAGTLREMVDAAGGPAAIATDPVGSVARVLTRIVGPDAMVTVRELFNDGAGALLRAIRDAAPTLLTIPAGTLIGAALGAPLGALWGAPLGGLLGALNPLNYTLAPLLGGLLGGVLGALATGIPSLIGSSLLTLPWLILGPLLGATSGTAIALAVWATVVFGGWLATLVGMAALSVGVAIGLIVLLFIGAAILTPFTLFSPLPIIFSFGAAVLILLGIPLLVLAIGVLFTAWIPVVIYALGAIPVALLGAALGGGLGLLLGSLIPLIGIPLLTALGAIPGALAGSITGALAATLASTLLNTLIGLALGGLGGALAGALAGGVVGTSLATPLAFALFTLIAAAALASWWRKYSTDPDSAFSKLADLIRRGWEDSALGRLVDRLFRAFGATATGESLGDLANRLGGLTDVFSWGDEDAIRQMLTRGGILGALMGAVPGGIIGAILGTLTGALNPLNLLTGGLPGSIIGGILGALTGALAGSVLSDLLGVAAGLGSIPLTFLPNLLALGALWTLMNLPGALAALAITLIPPLALATAATWITALALTAFVVPLFLMAWLPSVPITLVGFIINGAGLLMMGAGLLTLPFGGGLLFGAGMFVFGLGFGIAGFGATWASIVAGSLIALGVLFLLGSTVFVGIPTFLLTIPLFAFPALAVGAGWLLGLPLLPVLALGASLLEAVGIGSGVDLLSKLATIPLGALLGSVPGALTGATLGTLVAAVVRGIVYGLAGTGIGAGVGAAIGGPLGALAALLTHLRAGGGVDGDTGWFDGRILNHGGFGDILSGVPGLSGNKDRVAVPEIASPNAVNPLATTTDRSLADVTALV